jgi:hypothetical protein
MNMSNLSYALVGFLLVCVSAQAHFMSNLWPQKSLENAEHGPAQARKRVLIAGTTSDFRDAVAQALVDSLVADSVYVKTGSFKRLKSRDPSEWGSIVVFNTCIGWDIENRARKFISSHPDYRGFVLFTTSGDPDSCCSSSKLPRGIDAVSSGSVEAKRSVVIDTILREVRAILSGHVPASGATEGTETDGDSGATSKEWDEDK